MEKTVIQQSLSGKVGSKFEMARKYYSVLSALTDKHLTEREIQLVAFTAINGNISYSNIRNEFIETFKTSSATINNMVSRLKKLKVLVKDGSKVKVNPQILLDFNNDVLLKIGLSHG